MSFSSELYAKYNVPGPRYTSYPTVPYWDRTPTQAEWIESIEIALSESKKTGIGAALYIHIPFCESLCTYCDCNTRITRNHKVAEPYIETVLKEWDLYSKALSQKVDLSEIHLGGGTPTFLSPNELEKLIEGILSKVNVLEGAREFSIEADPRVTRRDHLETLYRLGFRRLSLGIQDFDSKVQEVVHRVQTESQVQQITETAREIGFTGINYDLIYGLPFQNLASIERTVNTIQRLRPDRIAFYSYAHVPWIKPSQRRFTEQDLPDSDSKRALYELGRKMLEEVGYHEIGMDHFALKSDSLWKSSSQGKLHRNFMGYISRQVSPLIGLGVSAIGDSWGAFAQNEKLLETYQKRVRDGEIPIFRGHVLSEEDRILRRHILNLMTSLKTQWDMESLNTTHLSTIHSKLDEFQKDGLLKLSDHDCEITDTGRAFIRNICMAFDARLVARAPATQLFSKTI